MGKNKISLSFINDGKEFTVPYISVKAQENLLEDAVKLEEKYKDNKDKYNQELNKFTVLRVLQTIDESVTLEDIEKMHIQDYMILFTMMQRGGRELSDDAGNFRQNKKEK